ncbi:MAG: hypothetical protein ABIJ09_24140 [Pseudomonadota bacterium]
MVSRLMVVDHPLAQDEEAPNGQNIVQRAADLVSSYNVTPQALIVGAGVGLFMAGGLGATVKGALVGGLISYGLNWLRGR